MSTNPFDDDYDPDLIPASARMKNPFDLDDDESPISVAVRNEISRQASELFYASFGDNSRSDSVDAAVKAVFDDIDAYDSTQPLFLFHPPSDQPKPGSKIARSKTVAHGNNLSPNWTPVRSASAKAVISRRQSSRFYMSRAGNPALVIPPDRDPVDARDADGTAASKATPNITISESSDAYKGLLFRPISTKSLSARCGALAAGDGLPKSVSRSKSSNIVAEIVRSRSRAAIAAAAAASDCADASGRDNESNLTEDEEIARLKEIYDLIEMKFRKHVTVTECEDGYFCQCEKNCPKAAQLYADRYGRLGNKCYIRPGFYNAHHLVDLFIDAYDEEKRLKEDAPNVSD